LNLLSNQAYMAADATSTPGFYSHACNPCRLGLTQDSRTIDFTQNAKLLRVVGVET